VRDGLRPIQTTTVPSGYCIGGKSDTSKFSLANSRRLKFVALILLWLSCSTNAPAATFALARASSSLGSTVPGNAQGDSTVTPSGIRRRKFVSSFGGHSFHPAAKKSTGEICCSRNLASGSSTHTTVALTPENLLKVRAASFCLTGGNTLGITCFSSSTRARSISAAHFVVASRFVVTMERLAVKLAISRSLMAVIWTCAHCSSASPLSKMNHPNPSTACSHCGLFDSCATLYHGSTAASLLKREASNLDQRLIISGTSKATPSITPATETSYQKNQTLSASESAAVMELVRRSEKVGAEITILALTILGLLKIVPRKR